MQKMQETWVRSCIGKITWRRKWQPTPVFLPGEFQGQEPDITAEHRSRCSVAWSLEAKSGVPWWHLCLWTTVCIESEIKLLCIPSIKWEFPCRFTVGIKWIKIRKSSPGLETLFLEVSSLSRNLPKRIDSKWSVVFVFCFFNFFLNHEGKTDFVMKTYN